MLSLRLRSGLGLCLTALAVPFAVARSVHANGLELLPGGTRSVARGGAVAARPEDPMAIIHNPAGLSFMPDDQFMINVDVPIHDMCVDLYGYYGWGVYREGEADFGDQLAVELDADGDPIVGATYATTPLPEVCNSGQVAPIPHMAWAGHITEALTLGLGMVAPTLVAGLQFGGEDGTVQTEFGGRPTPTRYQLIRQRVEFALAPSAAAAVRVLPWLSLGANLQVAMVRAKTRAIQNATTGTQPAQDWLVEVEAQDYFLPSVTFSAHARPLPALDLMASVRWVDSFDGSGEVVYETNTFQADNDAIGEPTPFANDPVGLGLIQVGLPWTATLGARYAGLLADVDSGAQERRWDPMDRELWDIELNVSYQLNERASENRVRAGEDVTVVVREVGGSGSSQTVTREDLARLSIDRHLQDSIAVRLGGSYSIVPRTLALHAGTFFESRGLDPAYATVESFAFARVGVGVGLMARLGNFDVTAAYGHIFQETIEVAPPPHQSATDFDPNDPTTGFDKRVGGSFAANGERIGGHELDDPDAPDPADADAVASFQQTPAAPSPARAERVVNAGKYTASFDVISIGASYHF